MTRKHAPPVDLYARRRCGCGHLLYADQKPGDRCLFCKCPDHRPAAPKPLSDGEVSS